MTELPPHVLPFMLRKLSPRIWFKYLIFNYNDGENVNIRIESFFRAHMEYKRPDVGLKIYREARLRFLVHFQTYVWALILHMRKKIAIIPYIYIFSIIFFIKTNTLTICEGYIARFTEFSNLRLGVYTPYAHEKRIQSLINVSEYLYVCVLFHLNNYSKHVDSFRSQQAVCI